MAFHEIIRLAAFRSGLNIGKFKRQNQKFGGVYFLYNLLKYNVLPFLNLAFVGQRISIIPIHLQFQ